VTRFLDLFKADLKQIKKRMAIRRTKVMDEAIAEFKAGLEKSHNSSEEL
jgi:hypothetical protein